VLDISVINTALSDIADGLNTSLSGLQWIIDGYTLPLAAVVLTAGSLADRFGRRKVFIGGLFLFTAASAACGASSSIAMLDVARAVQGLGAAMLFAVSLALIAHVTPDMQTRTRAMALYGATIGVALALGPFVGGLLTDVISWRAIFLINVPLGIFTLWLTFSRVPESKDEHARKIDYAGQITLIAGLLGVVLGLLRGNAEGWGSTLVLVSLIGGGALLAAFAVIESTIKEPMLPLRLFRQRDFAGAQLTVFALSSSTFAIFLYISLYLQGPLGLSPLETGLTYLPGSILMFFISGATPRLGERIGHGALAALGLAISTGGVALMLLTHVDSSWAITLPATILAFAGVGLFNPAISVVALGALPHSQSGLAAGAFDTFRQGGLALGTAALGAFVPATGGLSGSETAFVTGFHHAVYVAIGIGLIGTLGSIVLIARHRVGQSAPAPATSATDPTAVAASEVFAFEPGAAIAYEAAQELPPAA